MYERAIFKQKIPYVWYWATCRVQWMADCYIVLLQHCCWIILSRNLHRRRSRHGYYHFRIQSFVVIEHCYYNEMVVMIMWSCVLSSWMMWQLVLLLLLNGVVECLSKYHLPSRLLMVLLGLFLVSIFTHSINTW